MFGAIIGDIAGSRFEFNNMLATDFELFTPRNAFTDDSICTIAIAHAILENMPYADSLQYWCRKYPDPMGAYGARFAEWVRSANPRPYGSYGNGSAMRVSPCGWLADLPTVLEEARRSAACTHNHPEGIKGAMCVAHCIHLARQGASKALIRNTDAHVYQYDLSATCAHLRENHAFDESCQGTVPKAIICFLESTDFENALRLAISIGGDSDTIAAMTASMAHALHGIPETIENAAMAYLPDEFVNIIAAFGAKYMNGKNV